MKRMFNKLLSLLTALLLVVPLNTPVFAATCNATINFRVIPVYEDDTKNLGYDVDYDNDWNGTIQCTYTSSHSTNANHQIPIKEFHPDKVLSGKIRSGYSWKGWIKYTQNLSLSNVKNPPFGTYYNWKNDTTSVNGTGTHYIYMVYKSNAPATQTITLSYHANGGTNAPDKQSRTVNVGQSATFTISSSAPTRNGYSFLGWSTNSQATSASYQPGGTIPLSQNTTLYAVWKKDAQKRSITLTYDANGGTGAPASETQEVEEGQQAHFVISSIKPVRDGYRFLGWNTSSTAASADWSAGDNLNTTQNAYLYAVWERIPEYTYYLNYDFNGGTGGPENETVTSAAASYDFTVSESEPVRDGYTFKGWMMSYPEQGTEILTAGSTVSVTGTNPAVTLKAQWEENPTENSYAVIYHPNGAQGTIDSQTKVTTDLSAVFILKDSTGFTYEGFRFLGWSTAPDGAVEKRPGEEVTLAADQNTLNLYAVWEKKDPDAEKKQSKPALDKVIVTENGNQDSTSLQPGTEVKFLLKSNVPGNLYDYAEEFTMKDPDSPVQMTGSYKMIFHDDLGDKFELLNDEQHPIQVLLNGTPIDQKYFVVEENQNCTNGSHTCDFHVTVDLIAMYNQGVITDTDVAGATELSVAYTAKLSDDASTGKHSNYAWLKSEEPEMPEADEVFVDVFGLRIVKFADGNENNLLTGAKFDLYNSDKTEVVRSGETTNGILVFDALPAGTYYLYETAAPANYVRGTEMMEIQIVAGNENISSENGLVNYYIKKVNNTTAPSTGGAGTVLFTVGGGVLLTAAVIVLVYRRRKQSTEESK